MSFAIAQHRFSRRNLDPALVEFAESVESNQLIEGVVRLEDPGDVPPQFHVVCRFDRILTGRFMASDIWAIHRHKNVLTLKAARPLGLPQEEPSATEAVRCDGRRRPRSGRAPFGGRGCIVAALDFGLDFAHPNFLNADGTTRVAAFWHQGAHYDAARPNRYGYGRMFSRAEINRALRTEDPYQTIGYHPAISDPTDTGSHGTHTTDIAAGNGTVGAAGAAYLADLVFVHLSTPHFGIPGDLGDSVRMLEGIDYVNYVAQGRPWAINVSVGRTAGSHDATSPVEQGMHEVLRMGSGRAIVQSAGNYRHADLAVEGWLREGEFRDLLWMIDPEDTTGNEMDIWYSGKDRFVVGVRPPGGSEFLDVKLGHVVEILFEGSVVGRIYQRMNDPNNGDNNAEIFLYKGAPPGLWTVRLSGEYVISGRYHAWIERDIARPGAQSRFDPSITTQAYTLGTIATSPLVITVGAYDPHTPGCPPAPFSSRGPTRDERRDKPELFAPGVGIIAARSNPRAAVRQEGLLVPRSGTSMAAPHVTGVVAAMFEAAGRPLSINEVREYLRRSAEPMDSDEFSQTWGRLDSSEAIRLARAGGNPGVTGPATTKFVPVADFSAAEETQSVDPQKGALVMNPGTVDDFLERAESALRGRNSSRHESEVAFLRHLLSEVMGGDVSGSPVSPAALFQAAVCGGSGVPIAVEYFKIVGRPLERPTDAPRRGDWMIRVVPGTGDVGHVALLASGDLMTRTQLAADGIAAESSQSGFYGSVIEGGAYQHSQSEPFARRFLDSSWRVPPNTVIIRPKASESEDSEYEAGSIHGQRELPPNTPDWLKVRTRNATKPAGSHSGEGAKDSVDDFEAALDEEIGKFGAGTRKRVTDLHAAPFRWIPLLVASKRITRPSGAEERRGAAPAGTGVLISPRHVLTAAHVLKNIDDDTSEKEEAERVWCVFEGGGKGKQEIEASSWKINPDYRPGEKNAKTDYAVITLEKDADSCFWGSGKCGEGTYFGSIPPSIAGKLIAGDIVTAGYPGSTKRDLWCFTGKASTGAAEADRNFTTSMSQKWVPSNHVFHINADAEKGQSGSPIWVLDGGKRYLIGILVIAGESSNTVVTLNDDVLTRISKWTGQTLSQPGEEEAEASVETKAPRPYEYDFDSEMDDWWPKQQTDNPEEAQPLLAGLPRFQHFFQPMKPSADGKSWIPDGAEKELEALNPGFIGSKDDVVTGPLQTPLVDLLTGTDEFKRHLTSESIRTRSAGAGDKIRVAIVDLTGEKLTKPEFAGWGSTVAVEAASSGKVGVLLAAMQLLNDLKHLAAADNIKTVTDLIAEMDKRWKSIPRGSRPRLSTFLDKSADPPDLKFSAAMDTAIANIINNTHSDPNNANHSASVLLDAVGFPYAASVTWQSGLRHPERGGLWLVYSFETGGPIWSDPVWPSGSRFGHTGTALSLATFFTLLAQGRLVTPQSAAEMKKRLSTASFFQSSYWSETPIGSASIASKVGLLKKCVDSVTKVKDGKPVEECRRYISTHAHEPALIENGKFRYVVALMTVGIDNGVHVLQSLLSEIDKLIRTQNP